MSSCIIPRSKCKACLALIISALFVSSSFGDYGTQRISHHGRSHEHVSVISETHFPWDCESSLLINSDDRCVHYSASQGAKENVRFHLKEKIKAALALNSEQQEDYNVLQRWLSRYNNLYLPEQGFSGAARQLFTSNQQILRDLVNTRLSGLHDSQEGIDSSVDEILGAEHRMQERLTGAVAGAFGAGFSGLMTLLGTLILIDESPAVMIPFVFGGALTTVLAAVGISEYIDYVDESENRERYRERLQEILLSRAVLFGRERQKLEQSRGLIQENMAMLDAGEPVDDPSLSKELEQLVEQADNLKVFQNILYEPVDEVEGYFSGDLGVTGYISILSLLDSGTVAEDRNSFWLIKRSDKYYLLSRDPSQTKNKFLAFNQGTTVERFIIDLASLYQVSGFGLLKLQ